MSPSSWSASEGPLLLPSSNKTQAMTMRTIEISVGGKWRTVPAIDANGKIIIIRGRWVKVAHVNDEEWLETDLEDPEACVKGLREQRSQGLRADIFTFTQKPPSTLPRYQYPLEWDSVAVARTSSFKEWWEKLPQETRKNVRRSQKRGVMITVKELDNDLIRGIVGVNNDSPVRQERPYTHYGKSFEQGKEGPVIIS